MRAKAVIHVLLAAAIGVAPLAWGETAAEPDAAYKIVRENNGRVIRFTVPQGKVYSGPLFKDPPSAADNNKAGREEQEKYGQLKEPFIVDDLPVRHSPVPETRLDERAPQDFVLMRNTQLAPTAGSVSNVAEPSVGSQGNGIFETYNWYSSITTDNGATRSFVSPYTIFPNSPSAFAAGFCCDQRAIHSADRNLIFWFLQYIKTGSTTSDTSGLRVAMARGQAGLAANTWTTFDFTPAQLNLTGVWFDFPHMQLSANYLYFTTNIFTTSGDAFNGSAIFRVPLAQLDANQPLTVDTFYTQTFGSILAVHGAAPEGTRAGRNTMYFASVSGSTSLRILRWPEANAQPTVDLISGLSTTTAGTFSCPGPDTLNSCGRANTRAQGGWITDNELGVMWVSSQQAPARPFPFTRVAIFNPDTLALLGEPDIWSSTNAFLYPIMAVNQRGHLGGVIDNLGGDTHPRVRAIIRDDFSPNVLTGGWEIFAVAGGDSGAVNRWGDYNGVVPHERFPNTWLGVGRIQVGGSGNANARIRSFWFARERDGRPQLSLSFAGGGSGSVSSSPAGLNCTAACTANFDVGTTVTLTASASAPSTFGGWSGACSGTGSCVIALDQAASVTANFSNGDNLFANGFE